MKTHGCGCVERPVSRRDFLAKAGAGFGGLALASLLARDGFGAGPVAKNPLAAKAPMFPARAKSVIFLFMDGGPSHIDLFEPKPALAKYAGRPLPDSFERPMTAMGVTATTPLLASTRQFRRRGEAGLWVSDLLPETAKCVDDICFLQGCRADGQTHAGSVSQMNTGLLLQGAPSLGAWVTYGLGSECEELPAFVVATDDIYDPPGGKGLWGTGYMPATYQGTKLGEGAVPILDMTPAFATSTARQRSKIDFIQQLNRRFTGSRPEDSTAEARIASYELAFKMQAAAPEAFDIARETQTTQDLYGLQNEKMARNARNCLTARRLVERGVRFVQIYMGAGSHWDAHADVNGNHERRCFESDRPIAALLQDLKQRGLLDSTLVVWGGEFGRTPMSESGDGRDHNPWGFTMWMAGGGVKPGFVHGATDEIGLYAVEGKTHVHDIHATILHLLGLDHLRLTYPHNGRDERLTVTSGEVIHSILA